MHHISTKVCCCSCYILILNQNQKIMKQIFSPNLPLFFLKKNMVNLNCKILTLGVTSLIRMAKRILMKHFVAGRQLKVKTNGQNIIVSRETNYVTSWLNIEKQLIFCYSRLHIGQYTEKAPTCMLLYKDLPSWMYVI